MRELKQFRLKKISFDNVRTMLELHEKIHRPKPSKLSPKKRAPKIDRRAQKAKQEEFSSDLSEEIKGHLKKTCKLPALTSEEKYKVLEERDRFLRLKRAKPKSLKNAKALIGTCTDMCPEKERLLREFQRQGHIFEMASSSEYKIDPAIAVKQYSRSSADQEEPMSHELRTIGALKMTMSYLVNEIGSLCDKGNINLDEWFHFMWDRTRSIRKDITQQELCCLDSVELMEQCARFHISCFDRLHAEHVSVFDPKINNENLTKCLQTLKYMYEDLRQSRVACENEAEFRGYIILLNLNNGSFIYEFQKLPVSIQQSKEVKFAYSVYSALAMNNYIKFFKLVSNTTFLNACVMLRYFNQVRLKTISMMVKSYCRGAGFIEYPLRELKQVFGLKNKTELIEFCQSIGWRRSPRNDCMIMFNKDSFQIENLEDLIKIKYPISGYPRDMSKPEKHKKPLEYYIINGVTLNKDYKNHVPYHSFDSRGYLVQNLDNKMFQQKRKSHQKTIDSLSGQEMLERVRAAVRDPIDEKSPVPDQIIEDYTDKMDDYDEELPNTDKVVPDPVEPRRLSHIYLPPRKSPEVPDLNAEKISQNVFSEETSNLVFSQSKPIVEKSKPVSGFQEPETRSWLSDFVEKNATKIYENLLSTATDEFCAKKLDSELERVYEPISELFYQNNLLDTCKIVLDEQLSIQAKTSNSEKNDLAAKYLQKWKTFAKKLKNRRSTALNHTPSWPPPKTPRECVGGLFSPKEFLVPPSPNPSQHSLQKSISSKTIPIEFLIDIGLANNEKCIKGPQEKKFWKMVVSWPCPSNQLVFWTDKQIAKQYLNTEDPSSEKRVKIHKSHFFGTLHICIKQFDSIISEKSLTGLNALLFIIGINEKYKEVEYRLTKILLSRKKLSPIPVVLIIPYSTGHNKIEILPLVKLFISSGYITVYRIFSNTDENDTKILSLIQYGTLWLTKNSFHTNSLEMDYLKKIIEDSILGKFWIRIRDQLRFTPNYAELMNNPNYIIELHNESMNQLLNIIIDPDLISYTDFAPEFKNYLNNNKKLPSTYEYFFSDWKDVEYRTEIEQLMRELIMPVWRFPWPVTDPSTLSRNLMDYCKQAFLEADKKMAEKIVYDVFVMHRMKTAFVDIMLHLVKERIKRIDEKLVVIYDRNRKRHFDDFPWWLKTAMMQ